MSTVDLDYPARVVGGAPLAAIGQTLGDTTQVSRPGGGTAETAFVDHGHRISGLEGVTEAYNSVLSALSDLNDGQVVGRPLSDALVEGGILNDATWIMIDPVAIVGLALRIEVNAFAAGNVTVSVFDVAGGNAVMRSSSDLAVVPGLQTLFAPLATEIGQHIAVRGLGVMHYVDEVADGSGAWTLDAPAGGAIGSPDVVHQLQFRAIVLTPSPVVNASDLRAMQAATAASSAAIAQLFTATSQQFGRPASDPLTGGNPLGTTAVIVPSSLTAAKDGTLSLEIDARAPGPVTLYAFALVDGELLATRSQTINVAEPGAQTIGSLQLLQGEHVGIAGENVLAFDGGGDDDPGGSWFVGATGGSAANPQHYRYYWRINLASSRQVVTADAFEQLGGGGSLSLANVEKVVLVSNSYGAAGETLRGKAPVAVVSGQAEHNFGAFTLSGQTAGQLATMIDTNVARYGATFRQLGARWAIISEQQNGKISYGQSDAVYYAEQQRLIDTVRGAGARPIIASEWGEGTPYEFVATIDGEQRNLRGLRALADANGCPFFDVTSKSRRTNPRMFLPFFKEGHPGVRTGYMISDGYLRGLRTIPRPLRAMKLFRVRTTVAVSGPSDLLFRSVAERWRLFREIAVGQAALGPAKEATYDQATDRSGQVDVADEYTALAGGAATALGGYALIDCVLPLLGATGLTVTLSDTTCTVFARQLSSTGEAWVQLALAGGVFVVPDGAGLVDEDRLALLVTKAGVVSLDASPVVSWNGGVARAERWPQPLPPPTGVELLAQPLTVVGGAVPAQWANAGGLAAIVPADGADNLPGAEQQPPVTTGCVEVTSAAGLSQAIACPAADDPIDLVVRVWARRWVPIFTGAELATAPITCDTCDTATLLVTVSGPSGIASASAPMHAQVGLAWTEVEFRTTLQELASAAAIDVRSADAPIEIARVSVRAR